MKVIFVGIHNKPHKLPLCSSTKSGQLIDRVIKAVGLPPDKVLKANLYDVDHYPMESEKEMLKFGFVTNTPWEHEDIFVLLGQDVHLSFPTGVPGMQHILKVAHPASMRSHEQMRVYVDTVAHKIIYKIEKVCPSSTQ